ncbi:Nicotinate phosphoribosyltransferase [Pichia kudriavzevii]|uniref:nicotinate phosphoribosyltransferase n=1 Tax=Pichia kudriavzevii TaxID=4909 RepID=A0A1V2LRW7_PICKU|nr:Nicotinate phosphoribosyltransferase [Pichia kudriavzevii]
MKFEPVITSFLDTDLYKLTMQAAIHRNHPGVSCKFLLTNRTPDKKLNREGYEWLCLQIASLGELKFTEEEIEYLKGKLGYLGSDHFQWLRTVKLRPDKEVTIVPEVTDGMYDLTITAYGDWETVTLYEIPILSLLSEAYFRYVDTKWTINGELVAEYVNGIAKTENLNIAMEEYVNTVGHQHAGLALTDTYGTPNYLKQFDEPYVGWYVGVRQDSGNPEEYASTIADWYREKGYNDKVICFSDSLNVEKCKHLKKVCNEIGIGCIFGIGTNLTNDFDTKPLNIVMKLVECGEGHAIKISDNIAKNMGDERTVFRVKKELGYIEKEWNEGDESNRW